MVAIVDNRLSDAALLAYREQIIGLSGTPGSFFRNKVSAYREQALSASP
jgi:hypothetical protein